MNYSNLEKLIIDPPDDFNDQFEKILKNKKPSTTQIETLYGIALDRGNQVAIAIINFYVRENKISISKDNVCREAYETVLKKNISDLDPNSDTKVSYAMYYQVAPEYRQMYKSMFHESKF